MFEQIVQRVLEVEGGYVDHPSDRGGPTNFGITMGVLSQYRSRPVTKDDVRNLTRAEAIAIYKKNYWDPLNLDGLPEAISDVIFDQGVNFGIRVAGRRAQQVLNNLVQAGLSTDGVIGPRTRRVLDGIDVKRFVLEFICESQDHYVRIVGGNASQMVFLRGWINRSQKLLKRWMV